MNKFWLRQYGNDDNYCSTACLLEKPAFCIYSPRLNAGKHTGDFATRHFLQKKKKND
jgi:hypothetical protein